MHVQCRHLISALNGWAARSWYATARPIATQFHGHGCTDDLTTKRSYIYTWVFDRHGLCFDMLSMGVCTTRPWQTPGRLVQELNFCTVDAMHTDYEGNILSVIDQSTKAFIFVKKYVIEDVNPV